VTTPPSVLVRCTVVTRGENAAAAARDYIEFEPANIAWRGAGHISDRPSGNGVAVAYLPIRTNKLVARVGPAVIDLCTFDMKVATIV
jgi:hypothetical protein